jgi:hypothetical protein
MMFKIHPFSASIVRKGGELSNFVISDMPAL